MRVELPTLPLAVVNPAVVFPAARMLADDARLRLEALLYGFVLAPGRYQLPKNEILSILKTFCLIILIIISYS